MGACGLFLVLLVVACAAGAAFAVHNRRKAPCDTCKWLNFKFRRGAGTYRYRCGVQGGFNKQPLYCRSYERRSDGGGEDGGASDMDIGNGAAEDLEER